MKKAEIVNGIVENIISVNPDDIPDWCINWPTVEDVKIGSTYVNNEFIAPLEQIKPIPTTMSFAQAIIGLVTENWISEAEGDGWLDGNLPIQVQAVIDTLPLEHQFAAKARAKRPSIILRDNPLLLILAQMNGKTVEDLDMFFEKYSVI